jgi:FkbH-like protein
VRAALQRPDLLLRPDSLFPIEAHWGPKSESVARILQTWNISADTVLFIDDSALELAEVRNSHPTLNCHQFLPKDPNQVAALVSELVDLFGKPSDSEEDRLRRTSIRASAEFRGLKSGAESLEEVLAGAGGVLTIHPLTDPPDPRALELINKTNQFNLNGRRLSEAEWLQSLHDAGRFAWLASYTDRFGSLGKICVIAGRLAGEGSEVRVDTWVLSCRAFARRIEFAILEALVKRCGARRIHFDFRPTDRNGPVREMLQLLQPEPASGPVAVDATGLAAPGFRHYMRVE